MSLHPIKQNWPYHGYKSFVIYNKEAHLSRWSANKTIITTKRCGIEPELFNGVHKEKSEQVMKEYGLDWNPKAKEWCNDIHNLDAVAGCFMSHYKLWKKCVELKEPIIILEHDVEFQTHLDIPEEFHDFDGVINLGKPLWGSWWFQHEKTGELVKSELHPDQDGSKCIQRTFENCTKPHVQYAVVDKDRAIYCDCEKNWLIGAHSYIITPNAAEKLLFKASDSGIDRADVFIDATYVDVADLIPYPAHQVKRFSLIDKGWDNAWMDAEWSLPTFKQEAAIYGKELVLPCSPKWKAWEEWKENCKDIYEQLIKNQDNTEKNIRYGKIMFDNNEVLTGEHDGVFKDYFNDNKTLRSEGIIMDGEMHGEWRYYLADGQLDVIYHFHEGKLKSMDRQLGTGKTDWSRYWNDDIYVGKYETED